MSKDVRSWMMHRHSGRREANFLTNKCLHAFGGFDWRLATERTGSQEPRRSGPDAIVSWQEGLWFCSDNLSSFLPEKRWEPRSARASGTDVRGRWVSSLQHERPMHRPGFSEIAELRLVYLSVA